ncbi:hypothetical protein [uncultured Gemmiger sp.]|uniref:hypothetical protein n=1 Tax=uncultured Gemmiger sp. TaxID=1623490 RepID=UPI0025E5969D|nr:hypothetical protein [uncultured Gemmiger sp.]
MKNHTRLPLLVTAAVFALTACTPVADSAPAAEPTATPEITAEPASEPTAETGPLYDMTSRYSQSVVYDVMPAFNDQLYHIGTNVYKNDLNAGQVSLFYSCDDWCLADPYVTSNAVYLLTINPGSENRIIALSPDGTKTHEIPFDSYASTVVLYSDRYFYCIGGLAPYDTASGFRLDLQTGETTPWDLPAETAAAQDAAGDFAVTARLISDHPVPFTSDPEISDALLQNSMLEYDLTDVTTGKSTAKIAEFPYKGADDGSGYVYYTYLGKSGDDFYFTGEHSRSEEEGIKMSVLRVGSDGTQEDLGLMVNVSLRELRQNGELQWLFAMSSNPGTLTVYDLQGTQIAQVDPPAGVESYYPLSMLDDGRILLLIGYDLDHDYMTRYATIDADAFLNGSTEYTEMEFVG